MTANFYNISITSGRCKFAQKSKFDIIKNVNKITILLLFAEYVKFTTILCYSYDKFCN